MARSREDLLEAARVLERNGLYSAAAPLYRRAKDKASAKRCAAKMKPAPKRSR